MGKNWKSYRKLHRWPGLIISFVLLYYGFTGIIMNHRELLSGIDFNRRIMPSLYDYKNWNNAALKGNLAIGTDSILVYGNIGIWLTDTAFKDYTSFNTGFPKGSDNRKIFDILQTPDGNLYAAAFSGMYCFDRKSNSWVRFNTGDRERRFTGIESIGDTVYAVNRSHLFTGKSAGTATEFRIRELAPPPGYDRKVTLFQTIWQIHSGEIFGIPGKVYVDLLGIITIFLSVTGIIWFFAPGWIKKRVSRNRNAASLVKTGKWSLRWHNKIGAWTFPLLILLFLTGMFLRPPLLIAIGNARVLPIKGSHLDQPNPWYDKLRDILYDQEKNKLFIATSEGIFMMDPAGRQPEIPLSQPPVSVMGITVFEKFQGGNFLVGSFSGLFIWSPEQPEIFDFIKGVPYREPGMGRPVGDYKVTGMITGTGGRKYLADYSAGIIPLHNDVPFPGMPDNITGESKISLWSVCLEIHTGRIFENITGGFYILIVPLAGITGIIVVFSGYMVWRRKYRKKGYDNIL
jgi:hypothetical protein